MNTVHLMSELLAAVHHGSDSSLFERRRLIERALAEIHRLRLETGNLPDPLFDGESSPLGEIERVRTNIARIPDHHIIAAMITAIELIRTIVPEENRTFREVRYIDLYHQSGDGTGPR